MSLLKRKTHQPQVVEEITEPKEGFAQIDFADIDRAIEQKLTAAELRLWLYLMKIDRYGDRFVDLPDPGKLGIRLGMSRRTVEKAMFKLDELGLYTIRVKQWEGANSSAARARQTAQKLNEAKKEKKAPKTPPDKSGYLTAKTANLPKSEKLTEKAAKISTERLNKLTHPPEPPPVKDSGNSQTYSDYSDFIKTLSESERESFLEFGNKKASQLPKPPELPLKWIEANWQELYTLFLSTPYAVAASIADTDWTSHPDWENWLAQMREGVPRFVALGTCFDNKTRRAIADWADNRGLIWGAES